MNINILYEDEEVIVCEKPAGVAAQTRRLGQADMESLLKNYRAGKGEQPYIGVVHRLDQPVRGVMVFAKTKEAAADLSRQVQTKMADKFYYAVTDGVPEQKKGTLEDYLLRDGKTNTFHGTIFSIIFRKQFIVAATGKKKILELLKKFKLEQRNTDTNMYEKINEEIRYFEVEKILDDYRNESKEFLNKALKE